MMVTMVERSLLLTKLWRKTMNENAERINGWDCYAWRQSQQWDHMQ